MSGQWRAMMAGLALIGIASAASADTPSGAPAEWPAPVDDSTLNWFLLVDQLEFRLSDEDDVGAWDVAGWYGGDVHRLAFKSEGDQRAQGRSGGEAEVQLLYSRSILPFWDVQLGVRQDWIYGSGPHRDRTFAVLGLEGLAPQWFDVEPAFFLSDDGDVSFRLEATYEILLTQRLIAQPRLELDAAFSDVRKFEVESGFNDVELGLRLRYEIRRELAPYVGVNWSRRLGDTADLAREEGEPVDDISFVVGVRFWF